MMILTKLTCLMIRSTNHGGLSHNDSIRPRHGVLQAFSRHRHSSHHAVRTSRAFFVQSQITANVPTTSHALLNAYSSSAHMQSQAQNTLRCSFIYLSSLATSSSSAGIL